MARRETEEAQRNIKLEQSWLERSQRISYEHEERFRLAHITNI